MIATSPHQVSDLRTEHRRLRTIVEKIGQLCQSPLPDDQFYPQFLKLVSQALNACGGAVWIRKNDDGWHPRWQDNLETEDVAAHASFVGRCERQGIVALTNQHHPVVPDDQVALLATIAGRENKQVAIELLLLEDDNGREKLPERAFLQKMVELASTRPTSRTAVKPASATPVEAPQQPKPSSQQRLHAFSMLVHQSLDLETTGYAVVNELRSMLGCDRVTLALEQKSSCRLVAISGQDTIDRRADNVRQLETLAARAMRLDAPLWCDREASGWKEVLGKLGPLKDEAGVDSPWTTLGMLPLRTSPNAKAMGVLIVEHMTADTTGDVLQRRAKVLIPHVTQAMLNARTYSHLFLLPLWKTLGHWQRTCYSKWRRLLVWLAVLLTVGSMLALYPTSLTVHGRGVLEPALQRDVFADVDGVVAEVFVEHGDYVQKGDLLVKLRNTDLEVQIADVLGRRRAAGEHLAAIQRRRHEERLAREATDRLTGQILQLQEQLRSLDQQHALLLEKQERLNIRSDIEGRISTCNVHRRLMLRPVVAGQVLLTVADEEGPWQLEVYVDESEIGHLKSKVASSEEDLSVEYLAVTEPSVVHHGSLKHMDDHAQLYDDYGHCVRAVVDIDRNDLPETPSGTTIRTRMDCGQRPVGYVWLHRLAGFIYTRVFFRLG